MVAEPSITTFSRTRMHRAAWRELAAKDAHHVQIDRSLPGILLKGLGTKGTKRAKGA